MRNKKVKILSLAALLCTSITAAAIIFSNKSQRTALADQLRSAGSYNLSLEELSPSNKILSTSNGNSIEFAISGFNNKTFLAKGSYIYNKTPISGLKSLSIQCVNNGWIEIDYGWTTSFESQGHSAIGGGLNKNFDFFDENPSFFRIRCASNSIEVSSMSVTYSCIETPKPEMYDFTFAPSTIDSGVSITAYNGTATEVVVPSYYHNNMITDINYAFRWNTNITSVVLPNTISNIGFNTFRGCSKLSSISFSPYLRSIGNYAFNGCTSLTSFTMPNTVTSLGTGAFSGCTNLESIYISNTLSAIPTNAFHNCSSLTSLEIHDATISIAKGALEGCSSLESLKVPYIGGSLTENQYLSYIFNGNSYADNSTYIPSSLKTLIVSSRCKNIADRALYNCPMEEIILEEGYLESIGEYAFSNCAHLESIVIPDGVETVGAYAFSSCTSLKNAYIPSSVNYIGNSVFYNCSTIESLSLPFIGNTRDDNNKFLVNSFSGAWAPNSLKTVTLLEGCVRLGSYAFMNCNGLETLYLPDSLVSYYDERVLRDNYVTTVHINYSTSVYTLSYLSEIYLLSDVYIHLENDSDFFNVTSKYYIFCLASKNIHYLDSDGNEYTHIDVADGMTNIQSYCFASSRYITSIAIPDTITKINAYAFSNCYSLETIVYEGTVEEWSTIEKANNWNSNAPNIMVTCSNGSVSLIG